MPAIFNAANEVMVSAFLAHKVAFTSIIEGVAKVTEKMSASVESIRDIDDVSAIEQNARTMAESIIKELVA
jgi:1-deoxy-D-xylulose-5-phosphate reductoisomerase